ncbi:MAG: hypothetical protein ABR567_04360 [Myxococcales bacterium]|nr:gluconate 2-dehydrogenase subunit 3 family protein [Myxococcales bacterium]
MSEGRRGLLKKTLGGAALLVAAGAVPIALRRTRLRTPRSPLRFFTPAEYSIWAAVAERVLARDATAATAEGDGVDQAALRGERRPAAPTPSEIDVAGKADAFLAPLPANDARDLKQLLALFDNALFSVVTGGPPRPFTQMDAAEQDAHLTRWETSRLAIRRTGFQAMKRLCCALYFSDPRTYASIGYPGPPVELVRSVVR